MYRNLLNNPNQNNAALVNADLWCLGDLGQRLLYLITVYKMLVFRSARTIIGNDITNWPSMRTRRLGAQRADSYIRAESNQAEKAQLFHLYYTVNTWQLCL